MMSSKRGKRGRPKKFAVSLKITNEAQLQRTLDLINVKGDKPHINDIIEEIADRMEREEAAKSLALAKKWRKQSRDYGWGLNMLYGCMGEDCYNDEYGYDPYEEIYDGLGSKSSKKLKKLQKKLFGRENDGKKHKLTKAERKYHSDVDDLWREGFSVHRGNSYDGLDDEDNYEESYKSIKFYSDIENELSCREFDSIKSFSDFCSEHGYVLSPTDYSNVLNWSVVHCCLDPISLEYGDKEIITDDSYGALYWTVSEDISKHEDIIDKDGNVVCGVSDSGLAARTLTD